MRFTAAVLVLIGAATAFGQTPGSGTGAGGRDFESSKSVDLSAIHPGEYTVHFTVTDEIAHKSYERVQTVTVVD